MQSWLSVLVALFACCVPVGARSVAEALLVDGFTVLRALASDATHNGVRTSLNQVGREGMVQPGLIANIGFHVPDLIPILEGATVRAALESVLGPGYGMDVAHAFTADSYEENKQLHNEQFEAGQQSFRHLHITRLLAVYYPQSVTPSMGPTFLVPGSHHVPSAWSLRYHGSSSDFNITSGVRICAPIGSLLLMHYNLWHAGTKPDLGALPQWAVQIIFYRLSPPDHAPSPLVEALPSPLCTKDEAKKLTPPWHPSFASQEVYAHVTQWNMLKPEEACEDFQDLDSGHPMSWASSLADSSSPSERLQAAALLAGAFRWGEVEPGRPPLTRRLILGVLLFGSHVAAVVAAQAASWAIRIDAGCHLDWDSSLARSLLEMLGGAPWADASWLEAHVQWTGIVPDRLPQIDVRRFAAASALAGIPPQVLPHSWGRAIVTTLLRGARRETPENGWRIWVASCHAAQGLADAHEEKATCMDGNPSVEVAVAEGLGWLGQRFSPDESLAVLLAICADWREYADSGSLGDFDDGRVCFSAMLSVARLLRAEPGLCHRAPSCFSELQATVDLASRIHSRFGRCWRCQDVSATDARASVLFAARLALLHTEEYAKVRLAVTGRRCPHAAFISAQHFQEHYAMPFPLVAGSDAQRGCLEIARSPTLVCLPRIGLGLGHLQGKVDATALAVERWLRLGGRFVDTALSYRNGRGVSAGIAESGVPRSEVFVVSKVPLEALGFEATEKAIEDIIEELGSPVDLLLLHAPGNPPGGSGLVELACVSGPLGQRSWASCRRGSWAALEQAVRRGRARAIGVSNFGAKHIEELLEVADIHPAANEIEFHPFWQDNPLVEFCQALGIQPIVFGLFAGFFDPMLRAQLLDHPVLKAIGERRGRSSAQVLLQWGLMLRLAVLPAARTLEQMDENLRAGLQEWSLDADEVAAISRMVPPEQQHRRYETLRHVDSVL